MSFFSGLRWQDIVDFLVLSLALYVLLLWARQTRALRFAVIIVGLHACALWAMHFDSGSPGGFWKAPASR